MFLAAVVSSAGCAELPTPTIITSQLPNARPAQPYAVAISAIGGIQPYRWAITSGMLPPGVKLDARTGALSGLPSQIGSFKFTVRVADSSIVNPGTDARPLAMVVGIPSLQITTNSLPNAQPSIQIQSGVAAVGGVQPYRWSVASGTLPSGVSLNADNGMLSGKASQEGRFDFTAQVSDSSTPNPQTTMKALRLAIGPVAPQITPGGLPSGQVGAPFQASITGDGGLTPYTWKVAGALPSGLSLNTLSGAIAGTPKEAGTSTFMILLTDSTGQSAQKSYSITIAPIPLQITTNVLPNAQAGIQFQAGVTAAGGVQPYHWSIASGTLPSGVSFNADNGILSGKASQEGQFDFNAQVSDSSSPNPQTTMKALRLAVVAFALQIAPGGLPSGQVGAPFQASITGNGGVTPYTWTVAGALPSGLSLNASSGAIAGTPTQAGTSTFTIVLTDSVEQAAQKSSSITIAGTPQPLAISTTTLAQPAMGQAYSAILQATGGTPPYTWSVKSGQLPTWLTLAAATGQIAGTPSAVGEFRFAVQVADSASPPLYSSKEFSLTVANASVPPAVDQYGGLLALPSPTGATGYWRVEKFGNRWLWVTPLGNGFWSMGVFDVTPDDHVDSMGGTYRARVVKKYGDADLAWGPQQVRRLRSWGFNTILDFSTIWVQPTQIDSRWPGDHTQPEKMAAIWFIDGASYPVRNINNYAPQGAKDIFNGVNTTYYNGYVAPSTDPFDPNFAAWLDGYMAQAGKISPWQVGFSGAETDDLFGFGAGSSTDFSTSPPGHNTPNLAWIVLITSPTQTTNATWHLTYLDTKVYAKQALRDFLAARYGTIAVLNNAWGSNYTTFDSSGGWGTGTGLLDEDGRHSWIPDWDTLAAAASAMRQDLSDFLLAYAKQWFKTQRDILKAKFPNTLYFGPNTIGSWGAPPRKEILQAAGLYIDVLMMTSLGGLSDSQQRLDFLGQYFGDKPVAAWVGIPANSDSSLWRYPDGVTQAQRAQKYNDMIEWLLNSTVSSNVPGGAAGSKLHVGVRWWAYIDNLGETTNWGLVSTLDNAYDGKEATVSGGTPGDIRSSICKDPWGYPCGAEERNYGDFITAAKNAHLNVMRTLAAGKP